MECQHNLFTLEGDVTYLNCAYMSPMLKKVEQAGVEGIQGKRSPYNIKPEDFFEPSERLRSLYADLIDCDEPNRMVIIPSVSYGISAAAKNISVKKGQKVIVLGEQFPSNYYPWKRLCDENEAELVVIDAPDSTSRGADWNNKILEAIDDTVAAIAMPHVHWADGTLFDLKAIRAKTTKVGAYLVIDGTQSVGALPFSIKEIQPDALICAGYKWLLGPYSIGLAYYGPRFDDGVPLEENWINRFESENFSGLVNYNDHYQPGALRYEVGEHSNFILLPMLLKALEQIKSWGVNNIQTYCEQLFKDDLTKLTAAGFNIENAEFRGSHLFGIRNKDHVKMERIKVALQEARISVSVRGDAIRVSPHVYNSLDDVQKLTQTLINA